MSTVDIDQLMVSSGVQFGTSGVRGLVRDMTDQVCWLYVSAFLKHLANEQKVTAGDCIAVAGDLRDSSPRIMAACVKAIEDNGFTAINCGHVPSPAIALFGLSESIPTMMVTGSHIPDDRNGIKFNKADGEILKADEQAIRGQSIELDQGQFDSAGMFKQDVVVPVISSHAESQYIERFTAFFPANCLSGIKVGLYEHSSVSRDCFKAVLEGLGANVVSLGRSERFVAVDTEAIRPEDIALAQQWSEQGDFDCIVSTDGDGDRPLISDEQGNWLRGDIAGILCAQFLQVQAVVTPISSNSAVELSGQFSQVTRTRIGSPYVIEAMQSLMSGYDRVVGYEANGGFLQQSSLSLNDQLLSPLPTRDAIIVPLAVMLLAKQKEMPISSLLKTLPGRYTASDRLKNFPTEQSKAILAGMQIADETAQQVIVDRFPDLGKPTEINTIDGVRMTFDNGDIVHLRPSGNAPELRCYTESNSEYAANVLNQACIKQMQTWLN